MIHEPIKTDFADSEFWYSVTVAPPPEVGAELRSYAEADGDAWTVQIHGALYQYRNSFMTKEEHTAEIKGLLEDALDSGPGVEVTPDYWKSFRKKALERHQKIQALEAEGKIGNLLLPVELYEFVKAKTASQEFSSPTELVLAAMPYLRTWRSRQN